jgi:hypothetical protein
MTAATVAAGQSSRPASSFRTSALVSSPRTDRAWPQVRAHQQTDFCSPVGLLRGQVTRADHTKQETSPPRSAPDASFVCQARLKSVGLADRAGLGAIRETAAWSGCHQARRTCRVGAWKRGGSRGNPSATTVSPKSKEALVSPDRRPSDRRSTRPHRACEPSPPSPPSGLSRRRGIPTALKARRFR